ncbi:hypothetical protein BDP27DRAFT_1434407 [Rhodocollybia butyracea]|uniref:Uncharacterized protein n=1 Tax=Rhodocollybia butyracea TaxID=206335 RepID=A0A9P5TWZ9_9AGAR|nr:hypothetical protein BDP27DRAFT_1434407 [Rhodocollybia butyracea]
MIVDVSSAIIGAFQDLFYALNDPRSQPSSIRPLELIYSVQQATERREEDVIHEEGRVEDEIKDARMKDDTSTYINARNSLIYFTHHAAKNNIYVFFPRSLPFTTSGNLFTGPRHLSTPPEPVPPISENPQRFSLHTIYPSLTNALQS